MRFLTQIISMSLLVTVTYAAPQIVNEQLQVPRCLAEQLSPQYEVLAENQNFKIITVPAPDLEKIIQVADQIQCGRFINISQQLTTPSTTLMRKKAASLLQPQLPVKIASATISIYPIKHQRQVQRALQLVEPDNIWETLTTMTSFINRAATLPTGIKTADWLKEKFEHLAIEYGRDDTDTFFVATGGRYVQPSLVTVIGKDIDAPAVVIGAHMDTLGHSEDERMPGAGDDASGSATVMEIARVLLASKTELNRPVYIIWYAAEEQGLVGSQQVVQYFKNQGIPVYAAIQFDMTGYRTQEDDKTMWVFNDYTDKQLNKFVASLIRSYIKVKVGYSHCGYGCSDHASWTAQQIPAAFPCETSFEQHNPYIHTAADTMSLLNLEHMTNFTKLGLAFAIELSSD